MISPRLALLVFAGLAVALGVLLTWDPYPTGSDSYDQRQNGLWLGHRWYTGVGVRDGVPVTDEEIDALIETLDERGIRYAYVHVGPVLADGSIEDAPGDVLSVIQERAPGVLFLAWVGARVEKVPIHEPAFRTAMLETIARLRTAGFAGVHFDFEPLHDQHPGYIETLLAVREGMGPEFLISQATPRAGPYGMSFGPLKESFWSEAFYRETMASVDQTVVMAYDTRLTFTKGYVAFVRHQTELLGRWACAVPGHELLIGIPSYEDVPTYSDPEIENLRSASQGVRAGIEAFGSPPACLAGVAIYANWVTDDDEWRQLERHWTRPD